MATAGRRRWADVRRVQRQVLANEEVAAADRDVEAHWLRTSYTGLAGNPLLWVVYLLVGVAYGGLQTVRILDGERGALALVIGPVLVLTGVLRLARIRKVRRYLADHPDHDPRRG